MGIEKEGERRGDFITSFNRDSINITEKNYNVIDIEVEISHFSL